MTDGSVSLPIGVGCGVLGRVDIYSCLLPPFPCGAHICFHHFLFSTAKERKYTRTVYTVVYIHVHVCTLMYMATYCLGCKKKGGRDGGKEEGGKEEGREGGKEGGGREGGREGGQRRSCELTTGLQIGMAVGMGMAHTLSPLTLGTGLNQQLHLVLGVSQL